MCGRYILGRVDDLSERFQLRDLNLALTPTWNAAPSQSLPVILPGDDGSWGAELMRWGLLPRWKPRDGGRAPEPINARAETLAERPMFRPLIPRRRCVVPATGFYEWQATGHGKQPVVLRPTDQELYGFAGLWDETTGPDGEPVRSFTIITGPPNELVAPIHNRMAVILDPKDEATWLDPELTDWPEVEQLLRPYPADRMECFTVSKTVNNTRNDDPSLIQRIDADVSAATGTRT